jgi:hypothetical protein
VRDTVTRCTTSHDVRDSVTRNVRDNVTRDVRDTVTRDVRDTVTRYTTSQHEPSAYDRWLTWFGQRTPAWLDSLIRCTGIHDYLTSFTLSPMERQFLANGLRFICTPPKTHYPTFLSHYLDDQTRGWERFSRTLASRLLFQQDDERPRLAKFTLKGKHTHFMSQLEDSHRDDDIGAELQLLDKYRELTRPILQRAVEHEHHRALVQHQRQNCTREEITFIHRLMSEPSVTCKPADKNLGLVLVDTTWYDSEMKRMLSDTNTYVKFHNKRTVKGKQVKYTLEQLKSDLIDELRSLGKRHATTLTEWYTLYADQILKFLNSRINKTSAAIPGIYGLVKVHKPRLSMRPIVPCTRWITTPASVVVDHLLQEILRAATIPWIVKDTKSLVNELEGTVLPSRDGVFVTADIASLYTNIDTDLGLRLVHQFLEEQQIDKDRVRLIMDLLSFVMRNSYLSFKDTVYHQVDGTAMGTACAPTYANIFVLVLERAVIAAFGKAIHLYRRFLDDVFAFIESSHVEAFQVQMNSLHPKLKFEFVTHETEATFLDLLIHKGRRFQEHAIFDLRCHQKSMNLYLYIPWTSFHTEAAKKSFIQTELMRYIRNSSDREDYLQIKRVFFDRLRDRGYPHSFLTPLFNEIFYADRLYFLYPSNMLLDHPTIHARPPLSTCLLKRLARAANAGTESQQDPPVFVVPYTPLSRVVPTRAVLSHHWWLLQAQAGSSIPRPIIAYQSYPSLMSKLVFQKAKRMEELRLSKFKPIKAIQSTLNFARVRDSTAVAAPEA